MNHQNKSNKITDILLILSIAVFLFGIGYKTGEYKSSLLKTEISNSAKSNSKNIDFDLFWEAWDKIEKKFVDKKKIDAKKMFYGAVKGMVASVEDPYTFFLTPEENKQSKDDLGGKFEGIGAQLGLKDGFITIISPLKSSPAEKAGIRAGDIILKVNNESTKDWTLPFAVSKIRGPKGSKVILTVKRGESEIEAEVLRDLIKVASVEFSFESGESLSKEEDTVKKKDDKKIANIAYLKLNQFGNDTNDEWDRAVDSIKNIWQKKEIKGMILDVRDNPGGYLDGAVYIASEFLPKGKLVVKQETSSTSFENKEYNVSRNGKLIDIPLVVLVNRGSASASEILSGALKDYKRAILVGEKTFGKGSVQEALNLKDDAGLHVTVAKWILPNGAWINGKGIEPNIKVENEYKDGNTLTREKDLQLKRAVDELLLQVIK